MIEFYSYRPDRLNLNGDQANVFALRKRLQWAGIDSRVIEIESPEQLLGLDSAQKFLMIGHGSAAAMRSITGESEAARKAIHELASKGWAGLAVGSGYEMLFPDAARRERLSDYADVPAADGLPRLHGYINTDAQLPLAQVLGQGFVCTMVHGPVVARTPELADWFFEKMGVDAPLTAESEEADVYAEGASHH